MLGVGTFRVTVEIGDVRGSRFETVEALVDTGASYTWVPVSILQGLGVVPTFQFPFLLADGRKIEREMAETRVRLNSQERTTLVVFGDEGTQALARGLHPGGFRPGSRPGESLSHSCAGAPDGDIERVAGWSSGSSTGS